MDEHRKIEKIYGFPNILTDKKGHFCPGCSHGILTKIISEVIGEMGAKDTAIGVYGVGCASLMYEYIDIKGVAAPPGGACSVAAGIKSAKNKNLVFSYQGEGDILYGISSLIGSASRGERITVICENNLNMGISGGAMSPTTPLGFQTTTSPDGRDLETHGAPLGIVEILKEIKGIRYLARGSTHSPGAVKKTKEMIRKAFIMQSFGSGMGFIEVIGMCPTNMNLTPIDTALKVKESVAGIQMGEFKNP